MRALTLFMRSLLFLRWLLRNNEVLAREGIDTCLDFWIWIFVIWSNNEVLAREGIDTDYGP